MKIFKSSEEGREQVLRYMGPGESFNEVPAFDGGPNPASAAVTEDAEILQLPGPLVADLVERYPAFSLAVVRVLGARMRHLVALVEDLSFRQVAGRVARVLMQAVAPHEGVGAGAGRRPRVTQREIAEMAGTSRVVVARALKALEDSGAIQVSRTGISVRDPAKLIAFS